MGLELDSGIEHVSTSRCFKHISRVHVSTLQLFELRLWDLMVNNEPEQQISVQEDGENCCHALLSLFCHFLNQERVFLTISNYIFTTIFVAEMTVKVKHPFFFFHLFLSHISTFFSIIHSLSPHYPLIISLKPLTALFHLPSFISHSLKWPKSIQFSSTDFPSSLWLRRFTNVTPEYLQKQFPDIILLFSPPFPPFSAPTVEIFQFLLPDSRDVTFH